MRERRGVSNRVPNSGMRPPPADLAKALSDEANEARSRVLVACVRTRACVDDVFHQRPRQERGVAE